MEEGERMLFGGPRYRVPTTGTTKARAERIARTETARAKNAAAIQAAKGRGDAELAVYGEPALSLSWETLRALDGAERILTKEQVRNSYFNDAEAHAFTEQAIDRISRATGIGITDLRRDVLEDD